MATVGVFAVIQDEDGRILCVRQTYNRQRWTLPGGGMEPGETPHDALTREVREETGHLVQVDRLIGIYSVPATDDLALCFAATTFDRDPWEPNAEIAAIGFFAPETLPDPFSPRARRRIADALAGKTGVVHVFAADEGGPSRPITPLPLSR